MPCISAPVSFPYFSLDQETYEWVRRVILYTAIAVIVLLLVRISARIRRIPVIHWPAFAILHFFSTIWNTVGYLICVGVMLIVFALVVLYLPFELVYGLFAPPNAAPTLRPPYAQPQPMPPAKKQAAPAAVMPHDPLINFPLEVRLSMPQPAKDQSPGVKK